MTAPAAGFFVKGSPHVVLSATKVLEMTDSTVKVDRVHDGFSDSIAFDYAVLATGSTYHNAFQPRGAMSLADITASFVHSQAAINSATSILIAGGGPTGIELAGEIAAQHPGKKLTLVTSGASFTPGDFSPKLGQKLLDQLRAAKVDVHFNTRLDTGEDVTGPIARKSFALPGGDAVEADFLIVAYGSKPNSELVQEFDPSAISPNGYVAVDKASLQIKGHPTWFAIGDVADTPDGKTAVACMSQAAVAAVNIVALINGKQSVKAWTPAMKAILVSFGPNGGAGQLPLPVFNVIGAWLSSTIKSKNLMIDKWQADFKH